MSERPKVGADPDATVMMPARGPDPDATVMMPAGGPDPDATIAVPAREPDPDATIAVPAREPDPDATVAVPPRVPEPDATVMIPSAGPERAQDPDATVAIPTPGRRRDPAMAPVSRDGGSAEIVSLGGLNPLIEAANPILAVVPQIRHALKHSDPGGLRANLREKIDAFESNAEAAGAGKDTVQVASFALCALIDESAASTPWGTGWASDGLLAERQGENSGRDKFFELLAMRSEDPAGNLELLEFFYVCLALGFEGRYRSQENGRQDLAQVRTRLRDLLRQQRPTRDGELSGKWRGVAAAARRAPGALALWAAGSVAALLLVAVYLGYSISLGSLSDPVARELAQLKPTAAAQRPAPSSAATPAVGLQLSAEIARGEVAVADSAGKSTIVIRSDQLFASGSARLEGQVEPVISRVAEALDRVPGGILVTGHTDDVPIRTARFPSNWELSTERAASVVKLMSGKLSDPARLRAEGLADSDPVAPNDTVANRTRNRRVVIILRSAP